MPVNKIEPDIRPNITLIYQLLSRLIMDFKQEPRATIKEQIYEKQEKGLEYLEYKNNVRHLEKILMTLNPENEPDKMMILALAAGVFATKDSILAGDILKNDQKLAPNKAHAEEDEILSAEDRLAMGCRLLFGMGIKHTNITSLAKDAFNHYCLPSADKGGQAEKLMANSKGFYRDLSKHGIDWSDYYEDFYLTDINYAKLQHALTKAISTYLELSPFNQINFFGSGPSGKERGERLLELLRQMDTNTEKGREQLISLFHYIWQSSATNLKNFIINAVPSFSPSPDKRTFVQGFNALFGKGSFAISLHHVVKSKTEEEITYIKFLLKYLLSNPSVNKEAADDKEAAIGVCNAIFSKIDEVIKRQYFEDNPQQEKASKNLIQLIERKITETEKFVAKPSIDSYLAVLPPHLRKELAQQYLLFGNVNKSPEEEKTVSDKDKSKPKTP